LLNTTPRFIHIGGPERGFDEGWAQEMTAERKEIVFRGGIQKTIWRRLSTRQSNDVWDLAVATLILIESMKLPLSEMKPDYYEPKESDKETDGLKGQPEQPKWGAVYRVPLPNDPWQAMPNNRPPDKRSPWGVQNSPVVW
jgi:hypothetical protein